jgi:hypothetical protein
MQMISQETASKLQHLLRGELSAVQAYGQAIEHIRTPNIVAILQETHNCHANRANILNKSLRDLGCEPDVTAGAWGDFNKLIDSDAQTFGDKATVAILEEGEDFGLEQYRNLFGAEDPYLRKVVRELFPKQEGTHNIMRDLKLSLA